MPCLPPFRLQLLLLAPVHLREGVLRSGGHSGDKEVALLRARRQLQGGRREVLRRPRDRVRILLVLRRLLLRRLRLACRGLHPRHHCAHELGVSRDRRTEGPGLPRGGAGLGHRPDRGPRCCGLGLHRPVPQPSRLLRRRRRPEGGLRPRGRPASRHAPEACSGGRRAAQLQLRQDAAQPAQRLPAGARRPSGRAPAARVAADGPGGCAADCGRAHPAWNGTLQRPQPGHAGERRFAGRLRHLCRVPRLQREHCLGVGHNIPLRRGAGHPDFCRQVARLWA
mmetsp:Transcript_11492/g.36080  ORF Transcript_11492/g.36080 Transcript_11492/m.36080 type:complete len:281 (+) Transcript_11492:1267-2109(+)